MDVIFQRSCRGFRTCVRVVYSNLHISLTATRLLRTFARTFSLLLHTFFQNWCKLLFLHICTFLCVFLTATRFICAFTRSTCFLCRFLVLLLAFSAYSRVSVIFLLVCTFFSYWNSFVREFDVFVPAPSIFCAMAPSPRFSSVMCYISSHWKFFLTLLQRILCTFFSVCVTVILLSAVTSFSLFCALACSSICSTLFSVLESFCRFLCACASFYAFVHVFLTGPFCTSQRFQCTRKFLSFFCAYTRISAFSVHVTATRFSCVHIILRVFCA